MLSNSFFKSVEELNLKLFGASEGTAVGTGEFSNLGVEKLTLLEELLKNFQDIAAKIKISIKIIKNFLFI